MKKILLVDGNSQLYRAFFALPPLSYNGVPLNAIHGFFTMLFKAMQENKPSAVYVMFDEGTPTFRHNEYQEYKAGRNATPDDLKIQFSLLREFLKALNIPAISKAGFEADDLLGSASKIIEKEGGHSIILTGDRDALQLSTDSCSILITKKGISESLLLSPSGVKEHYGVEPDQIRDLKGLMGDNSDNIPGVPGVGEKTALKLIDEYGSLEEVIKNADKIKGKLGEKIRENSELATFSKKLATIVTTVPIDIDINIDNAYGMLCGISMLNEYKLNRVIQNLRSLYSEGGAYNGNSTLEDNSIEINIAEISEEKDRYDAWDLVNKSLLKKKEPIVTPSNIQKEYNIDEEDSLLKINFDKSNNIAIYIEKEKIELFTDEGILYNISIKYDMLSTGMDIDNAITILCYKLKSKDIIVHDQKEFLKTSNTLEELNIIWDTMIAEYIINPVSKLRLIEDIVQSKGAYSVYSLACKQIEALKNTGLIKLICNCEQPLSRVLYFMEKKGFFIDRNVLFELNGTFSKSIVDLQNEIYDMAGFSDFNINSPKQLSDVLFERLNLPHGKRNKSGYYSTGVEVLEKLQDKYEIVDKILEYRKFNKLKSTYIDALIKITEKHMRVHSFFDQIGTVTGRISSLDPNLQNIPVRSKEGAEIRKAFVAEKGKILVDADYSQIELRVLAHLSHDENMIKAFKSSKDIHTITASEIFGVDIDKVDSTMRSNAKAVNFGIVYGISSFGLAKNTNISFSEADKFIELYFERYPKVREYMDKAVEDAKNKGESYTLFNRRRPIPEISSSNANLRAFGSRIAMNTPVQGTAADIIKLAMISVSKELESIEGASLILQVHDELIIECNEADKDKVETLLKNTMENIVKLDVPLVVDVNSGKSWYDSK